MELKRLHRLRFMISKPCLFFLLSISALFTTISSNTCPDSRCALKARAGTYFQEFGKQSGNYMEGRINMREQRLNIPLSIARRYLSGPGSSPPRCTSKCGRCTPCKPVHVPVPPGTPVTTEYYPEAWRCKCGNRLYMP
ncbi:PREDICTED: EPIDERMAL PATTERNING FACTOR-like protein 6 [Prunus mume]|uniref:Epidermal patterning factor-like protein n=1 Tax=Prunus mume TaxID=102107 RepID=A0ABM0PR18_PRUMU|nr:PREDICTED: EPIDERMAL PATTERNING FACTOR-like protein 6 [Prunus mume]XP_008243259.1 PREDICTED: EPIDERMAL PATTERNING FACTOR-like protein 6 [Prunus mume]